MSIKKITVLSLAMFTQAMCFSAQASDIISIPLTKSTPLLDGICHENEWQSSYSVELSDEVQLSLLQTEKYIYVCAKGKNEDYTALDIYLNDVKKNTIRNLHISAQLGEREYSNGKWSAMLWWNQQGWTAFWVPFSGFKEENGIRKPSFLRGSNREVKFSKTILNSNKFLATLILSSVTVNGKLNQSISFPLDSVPEDSSTWANFSL